MSITDQMTKQDHKSLTDAMDVPTPTKDAMALNAIGIDIRESQIALAKRRIRESLGLFAGEVA